MFTKTLVATSALLSAVMAAPSTPVKIRAEGGVVTGVPANPVQFPGGAVKGDYVNYNGDGSEAAGWPNRQSWASWDNMWNANVPVIQISCTQFGDANPSPDEIQDIHDGILQASSWAQVDPRFILAIMMQESTGCPRVGNTANGVSNPGLMQDHAGSHNCIGKNPCPKDEITGMLSDGTGGTTAGDGLAQLINQASANTGIFSAWPFYKAARMYNSGSIDPSGDINAAHGATANYPRDIANRVMGWVKH